MESTGPLLALIETDVIQPISNLPSTHRYGAVASVRFARDRQTGEFRGLAFVDMEHLQEACVRVCLCVCVCACVRMERLRRAMLPAHSCRIRASASENTHMRACAHKHTRTRTHTHAHVRFVCS